MSRTIAGCGCPGHPGTQIVGDIQTTSATKLNSGPLPPAGRRVSQIPEWVPPSLKKLPVGITERASDCQSTPVVDSFEKANSIYNSKVMRRVSSSPPPLPKSNGRTGLHKKDNSSSPVTRATERLLRQSFSPNRLMGRDTRVENWGTDQCSKFPDDLLGRTTINSETTIAPSKADESALVDRDTALNWIKKKRDLFPCRDSPRPQESSPDGRRAGLDFQRYGDLEGRGDAVSWRNLSPVERRQEESKLYEKMIIASQHANSKARAEGVGGISLRI